MILVKPDAQIIQDINGEEILKKIEFYGRTCYRSRDKATPESSKRFVQNLIDHNLWKPKMLNIGQLNAPANHPSHMLWRESKHHQRKHKIRIGSQLEV